MATLRSRTVPRARFAGRLSLTAACLAVALAGCAPAAGDVPVGTPAAGTSASATRAESTPTTDPTPLAAASASPAAAPQGALAAALLLEVKGRAPKTGYTRDEYGPSWKDVDRNGCDQRNDVLDRDLTDVVHKPGTGDCVVLTGNLVDPYGGLTIAFQRGEATSGEVQIDHVVALSDAWQKGAQQWTADTRERFANDYLNLLAVDGPLNAQKSDGDAATWLPPNKGFRCEYVARQVVVKITYGLWVTAAEQSAMVGVLSTCPDQVLPDGVTPPPVAAAPAPAPVPDPAPAPAAEPQPAPAPADVSYANCAAARAAGAAPVLRGDPGYAAKLDRDGDGIGCE
ncbi:MAG: GmrSD restriction endonuclease domain-containing protein [Cellulomonas sp.]